MNEKSVQLLSKLCIPLMCATLVAMPLVYNNFFKPAPQNTTPADSETTSAYVQSVPYPDTAYIPPKRYIIDVPYINQEEYPTGCESVSTTMVLNYWGIDCPVDFFLSTCLKSAELETVTENGREVLYGESPYEYFIGNPYDSDGLGCYAPVIVEALNYLFADDQYVALDVSGLSLEQLTQTYILNDIPVIIWATIGMKPSYSSLSWKLKASGETFNWISGEHCLVLTGFNEHSYLFNDPSGENGTSQYLKGLVTRRYTELGMQAVVIVPND